MMSVGTAPSAAAQARAAPCEPQSAPPDASAACGAEQQERQGVLPGGDHAQPKLDEGPGTVDTASSPLYADAGGGAPALQLVDGPMEGGGGDPAAGDVAPHALVAAYIAKLQAHCRMCELMGRYEEASFAARRAQDLRTAQAEMRRAQLSEEQRRGAEALEREYTRERDAAEQEWRCRVDRYDAAVAAQVAALRAAQAAELALEMEAEAGRARDPRLSAAYHEQRKLEELLLKQGQYRAAHEAARGAELLRAADAAASVAARDAACALRAARLSARHQAQLDALLQRAGRGRDELEMRRAEGAARVAARYRAAARELSQAHALEAAHLEGRGGGGGGRGAAQWEAAGRRRQLQQRRPRAGETAIGRCA